MTGEVRSLSGIFFVYTDLNPTVTKTVTIPPVTNSVQTKEKPPNLNG